MENAIFFLILSFFFLYQSDRAEKKDWVWQALFFSIAHLVSYIAAWTLAWKAWLD